MQAIGNKVDQIVDGLFHRLRVVRDVVDADVAVPGDEYLYSIAGRNTADPVLKILGGRSIEVDPVKIATVLGLRSTDETRQHLGFHVSPGNQDCVGRHEWYSKSASDWKQQHST